MDKHYYAGYNSYGISVLNGWTITTHATATDRDAYVDDVNSRYDQPRAESMTAASVRKCIAHGNGRLAEA
jgi:hypothetical protein